MMIITPLLSSLITSQFDTALKRERPLYTREARLITSQFDTAPKLGQDGSCLN